MNEVYFIEKASFENFTKLLSNISLEFIGKNDFVALKTHFGEEGNTTFITPRIYHPLIKILLEKKTFPFFTDTNTIYTGKRSNAVNHIRLAHKHGFKIDEFNIPIIIADGIKGNNYVEIEINLKHFKKAKIASDIYYSDQIVLFVYHILKDICFLVLQEQLKTWVWDAQLDLGNICYTMS